MPVKASAAVVTPKKHVHVLFDEYHSESWSISRARASEINPQNPSESSYEKAGKALEIRDFVVDRNVDRPLLGDVLGLTNVVVLLHPCDPKWEATTSNQSPKLSKEEIAQLHDFVFCGGGLVVLTEYEHEKYGNNLNELLEIFGLKIGNTTVKDETRHIHENPTWFFPEPTHCPNDLSHLVEKACFYRASSCRVNGPAKISWRTSQNAQPPLEGVVGTAKYGAGRVTLVTDSSLFGDKHFQDFDHQQLWLNIIYWTAAPVFHKAEIENVKSDLLESESWQKLKAEVNSLRALQNQDGSVSAENHADAKHHVDAIVSNINQLNSFFPPDKVYFECLLSDFNGWVDGGFAKPDFGKSLAAFNPELDRRHNLEHLVVFPMYTPNASRDTRFEALLIRTPWPDWLAELEQTLYQNEKFVPGHLIDYTDGYNSECAVFFPETISVTQKPTNNFAMIFCDREARRLQSCALKAAKAVHLDLHPQLECFLGSLPVVYDTLALWDLIHDKSHSVGELPFDPFMIRQRAPYWMYALEELRVDLRSFCEAARLAQEEFPFAQYAMYAILLDRIFRFPITGNRIKNYDALGGEILFAYLHQKDILIWADNKLTVRWDKLVEGVSALREELQKLYKSAADCSKMSFWIAAHDLISQYVCPNVASVWKKSSRVAMDEVDTKKWISLVQDDEFPLGNFHANLRGKLMS